MKKSAAALALLLAAVCTLAWGHPAPHPPAIHPCVKTLLRHPAKNDLNHESPFSVSLATLARRYGGEYLPQFVDEGFAVEVERNRFVVVLGGATPSIPGSDERYLLLLDEEGRLLDRLCCSISNRLTRLHVDSGTYVVETHPKPESDGARLVIRYTPAKCDVVADQFGCTFTWRGKTYSFQWTGVEPGPGAVHPAEWWAQGLCRVAVRGDQFVVLYPRLEQATDTW